jgi:phosphoglycerate dehydrogenase-like enzyme
VAVIGLGVIGQKMSSLLQHLDAHVLGVDPNPQRRIETMSSLDDAVAQADVITLHCSLNVNNRDQFNHALLQRCKPGTIVINTARGPLLDVAAAARLVQEGHLGGLAVDVFPVEPYASLEKLKHPQVLLSPHASGYTHDLAQKVSNEVFTTLSCWTQGKPLPHLVI